MRSSTVILSAVLLLGCSVDPRGHGGAEDGVHPSETVRLAILVAPGLVVDQVDYAVMGNGQDVSGVIATPGSVATPSVQIGLPGGTGYIVSLRAVASNGVHCAGSRTFDVVPGTTNTVSVDLQCDAQNDGDRVGGTIVNGRFFPGNPASCPDVAFFAVSPLQTGVGTSIGLAGAGTAGTVTAFWRVVSGGAGHLADGTTATDSFVCDHPGLVDLVLVVTDGRSCVDASPRTTVVCVSPSHGGPGVCGNGIVDDGEECDDGNVTSGDGCTPFCIVEGPCGNGVLEPGEECDPPLSGVCTRTCERVPPGCGDGIVQGNEQCDPPMFGLCAATCRFVPAQCGDGIPQNGEQCDPPSPGFCSLTCQVIAPVCGNGVVQLGEECDPPVTGSCSPTCRNVTAECGDGFVQPPEACDDGNDRRGDGCDPLCAIETNLCGNGVIDPGEACDPPQPGVCTDHCFFDDPFLCGNGILDPGEQCDPADGKACTSACQLGGPCTTCEEQNCGGPSIHTDCTEGPAAALCMDVLHCARVHHCYELDPAECYCGAHDLVACQNAAPGPDNGPAGPCVAEYETAAGTSAAGMVLLDLTDPSTPLGRGGFIQQCDIAFCTAECF